MDASIAIIGTNMFDSTRDYDIVVIVVVNDSLFIVETHGCTQYKSTYIRTRTCIRKVRTHA